MRKYLQNWNLVRILRLVFAIVVIVQGFQVHEWLLVILGGIFSLMPLMNIGCGSTSGCSTSFNFNQKKNRRYN
ncbi:hypothetical protein [Emticicia fontis]